ncbi:MgtC/SapB family protein [Telluria aromaticivorans]|uniref:Protein MgtC n=1 Tax=Telluria aromaticivorans TaxID=2725995 RepID=A0A7Y2P1K0_9BURK|nr:MgtC/SapB family protein [Telluria aromaticivorans]NNG25314.1 MgtC/SapB family protein [Telluria aromaticivorans]
MIVSLLREDDTVWLERSWQTILQEFSDLGDVESITRVVLRLMVAVVLGGMLGYERETVGASAGLRTHMLVSLGSALFVLIPLQAGMGISDLSRVLQGVTAGIGFIGAGAILKHSNQNDIKGVTTAASVWLTAAIGIAAGMGREATAVLSALFALAILGLLRITPKKPLIVQPADPVVSSSRRNVETTEKYE